MVRETSREIDTVAAQWAARIDRAPLSDEQEGQLEAWCAGDTRRRGAFMRMRAIALNSERAHALGATFDPTTFGESGNIARASFDRRRILLMGGSAVAACSIGALGLGVILRGKSYDTRLGEVRVVTLADGSVITLNTKSTLHVRYSRDRRLVSLEEGEALFDVAKDVARPFIVEAAGTAIRAVGTSFSVKRLASAPVEVLVREGIVEVSQASMPGLVRLAANMRLTTTKTSSPLHPAKLKPDEVSREMAWKSGRIAFEGDTLAQAAETFARYSDTRIVIDDPAVGREEITGLFAANDPVSFARAAALSLNLRAVVGPGEVRLSR